MPHVQRYDPDDAYEDYITNGLPWAEVSAKHWPGVDTSKTRRCREKLEMIAAQGLPLSDKPLSDKPLSDNPTEETEAEREARERGPVNHSYTDGVWTVSLPRTRIADLPAFLEALHVDESKWECYRFDANQHEMGSMPRSIRPTGLDNWTRKDSIPIVTPLFSIKAFFRLKVLTQEDMVRAEIDRMLFEIKEHAPNFKPFLVPPSRAFFSKGRRLLELSIPDLHMGKKAWALECGEDYDVNIAERVFEAALEKLMGDVAHLEFERIIFVVGNDLLNADNFENTTTAGTPQTTDNRHHRTFYRTRKMLVAAVERLLTVAPVDIVTTPGNHDRFSSFAMAEVLAAWFHTYTNVAVDNSPPTRKYYEYGQNMICFTHGDKEKQAELSAIMISERREMWGRTRFHEAHIGHLHKTKVTLDEEHGFRVRTLPSLCAAEDWHTERGYVGNVRSAEAHIWDWSNGYAGSAVYNVPEKFTGEKFTGEA